ncbi:MAG: hypothetical protein LBE13_19830 [Bacteroidales bacterium]|nr:hypothetical protein [Bacteroidales bacterium]
MKNEKANNQRRHCEGGTTEAIPNSQCVVGYRLLSVSCIAVRNDRRRLTASL